MSIAVEREVSRGAQIARAIVATVAYADVFDYPLRPEELRRYLIGAPASPAQIRDALAELPELRATLDERDGFVMLAGREATLQTRRRRAEVAARMWPRARRYGRQIARLPFVRMVAVTGALAVDNVEREADIDYLVVTEPGRLWVCRLLTIALVRLAALRGDIICPNYFLADTALALDGRGLYAAHELAQMVPLAGLPTYRRMREINRWSDSLLPNASGAPHDWAEDAPPAWPRHLAERALRTPPGGALERWEMGRKVRKFERQGGSAETAFSPQWCKGHFDGHGRRVMDAYAARLRAIGYGSF